ncbi:hypothetical protein CYMTET_40896 [Cymbomonas tetramitiformis]|uniref:Uncharacterized protein n=1 Tax=Cymbomonas tetramitiformis TaxID=36881 RepID=A0AAE0C986_9CHLO|nr:hypothetical protein CYMTET_40896 [Cymbomonas tetramitiformis]
MDSLYSLEVLVTNVKLSVDLPCQHESIPTLTVAVRLLDFPVLLIHGEREKNSKVHTIIPKGDYSFNSGKSCLFKANFADLDKQLKETPLFIVLTDATLTKRTKVHGSGSVALCSPADRTDSSRTAKQQQFWPPTGGYLKETVTLYSLMGHRIGTLGLYVRLSCRGQAMLSHFTHTLEDRASAHVPAAASTNSGAPPETDKHGTLQEEGVRTMGERKPGSFASPAVTFAEPRDVEDTQLPGAPPDAPNISGQPYAMGSMAGLQPRMPQQVGAVHPKPTGHQPPPLYFAHDSDSDDEEAAIYDTHGSAQVARGPGHAASATKPTGRSADGDLLLMENGELQLLRPSERASTLAKLHEALRAAQQKRLQEVAPQGGVEEPEAKPRTDRHSSGVGSVVAALVTELSELCDLQGRAPVLPAGRGRPAHVHSAARPSTAHDPPRAKSSALHRSARRRSSRAAPQDPFDAPVRVPIPTHPSAAAASDDSPPSSFTAETPYTEMPRVYQAKSPEPLPPLDQARPSSDPSPSRRSPSPTPPPQATNQGSRPVSPRVQEHLADGKSNRSLSLKKTSRSPSPHAASHSPKPPSPQATLPTPKPASPKRSTSPKTPGGSLVKPAGVTDLRMSNLESEYSVDFEDDVEIEDLPPSPLVRVEPSPSRLPPVSELGEPPRGRSPPTLSHSAKQPRAAPVVAGSEAQEANQAPSNPPKLASPKSAQPPSASLNTSLESVAEEPMPAAPSRSHESPHSSVNDTYTSIEEDDLPPSTTKPPKPVAVSQSLAGSVLSDLCKTSIEEDGSLGASPVPRVTKDVFAAARSRGPASGLSQSSIIDEVVNHSKSIESSVAKSGGSVSGMSSIADEAPASGAQQSVQHKRTGSASISMSASSIADEAGVSHHSRRSALVTASMSASSILDDIADEAPEVAPQRGSAQKSSWRRGRGGEGRGGRHKEKKPAVTASISSIEDDVMAFSQSPTGSKGGGRPRGDAGGDDWHGSIDEDSMVNTSLSDRAPSGKGGGPLPRKIPAMASRESLDTSIEDFDSDGGKEHDSTVVSDVSVADSIASLDMEPSRYVPSTRPAQQTSVGRPSRADNAPSLYSGFSSGGGFSTAPPPQLPGQRGRRKVTP